MDCPSNVFTIFLGDAKTLTMKAVVPHCTCDRVTNGLPDYDPIDLTSVTDIAITLLNSDGSSTVLKLSDSNVTVVSATQGVFSAAISSLVSSALMTGVLQNIDVTFTFDTVIYTKVFSQVLTVLEVR
jgi:hypothetical protein